MHPIESGNPDLVTAMLEIASQDSPENRKRLYSVMLQSVFIVPTPAAPSGLQPGMNMLGQGANIQIIILNDNKGTKVTPFFTGLDALRNWHPSIAFLGIGSRDLFNIVLGTEVQEIVINPFDPARKMTHPGGRITRHEFELLAKGIIPQPAEQVTALGLQTGEQVMIGVPAKRPPDEVLGALSSAAEKISEIAELYLFQMAAQQDGRWLANVTIGIQFTEEPRQTNAEGVIRQLSGSIQGKLPQGEGLGLMVLRGDFGQKIRNCGILIFRRT